MITQENFKANFSLIKTAFSIKFESQENELAYLKLLFQVLKNANLTDEDITKNTNKLVCEYSKKKFNETFGFDGVPAPADFLEFFGKDKVVELTTEDIARQEIEKILEEAKYGFSTWKAENPITAKVINSYNKGLATIYFDLFDSFNSNRKDLSFYKKDMLQRWLNFEKSKDQVLETLEVEKLNKLLPNFNKN